MKNMYILLAVVILGLLIFVPNKKTDIEIKIMELEYMEKLYSVRDDIDLKIEQRRVDSLIVSFERYLNNREKRKNGQN